LLRIPKIGLEVPVLEGTDDLSLNRAVGHIVGTPRPGESGNVGIAGHRDGFFRGLKDVAPGDTIEIVTSDNVNKYVIDEITIVDPSNVSVLAPRPQPSLTLVTCYPFYFIGSAPQRYIVHASLATEGEKKLEASNHTDF
jgi:sortase A